MARWRPGSPLDYFEQAVLLSSKEFVRGFLIGQLALLLLLIILARIFLFRSTGSTRIDGDTIARPLPNMRARHVQKHEFKSKTICTKLGIETMAKQESVEWLSLLVAKALEFIRSTDASEILRAKMEDILNASEKPAVLGKVHVVAMDIGDDTFPRIHWIRSQPDAQMAARIEWEAVCSISLETSLMVPWPTPAIAALPCSLTLTLNTASLTLLISLEDESIVFSLQREELLLDLQVRSLLGHRSKLKDLPKVSRFIISRLQSWLADNLIEPCGQRIPISHFCQSLRISTPK